jgi:dihydroorotase
MNILIKQAKVYDESSAFHHKTVDVLIEGGLITEIKKSISTKSGYKVIEEAGLSISQGWIDMQVVSCDPGFEHKEDLESLVKSAAAGGYTAVCVHNYNQPALHNKTQIEYILNKTQNKIVDVYPFGTITVNAAGNELAEMYDMKQSGALAFSDYKHPIKDAGMMMRALQYATNVNSFIIVHCNDESISVSGQMNEGETSTTLGLKGIPALAEELMLQRNITILEYTGGKMHVSTISTKGSVELIKKAKSAGLQITCGVAAVNLMQDDSVLTEFDSNYKLNPPLRTKKDVVALRHALENGTIDVIVSDHLPQDPESKELEFDLADFGMIGLQTSFNCALEAMKEKGLDTLVKSITVNPRQILGISNSSIAEGVKANVTLFNPIAQSSLNEKNNYSRSKNSPFFNKSMIGRIVGVVNGTKHMFN